MLVGEHLDRPESDDYTRRLIAVYQYIHECTGTWHDSEVALILYDLRPGDPKHVYNVEALKSWRNRHKLKSRPGRAARKP